MFPVSYQDNLKINVLPTEGYDPIYDLLQKAT